MKINDSQTLFAFFPDSAQIRRIGKINSKDTYWSSWHIKYKNTNFIFEHNNPISSKTFLSLIAVGCNCNLENSNHCKIRNHHYSSFVANNFPVLKAYDENPSDEKLKILQNLIDGIDLKFIKESNENTVI